MVVGCAYLVEFWVAWYSANQFEQKYFWNRVFGEWWWAAWIMLTCNMVFPLSLFSQRLRRNPAWLFILSIFINLGMWFERFVIIVPTLSHEFEPWQWAHYVPSWVDISILVGSFGWFFMDRRLASRVLDLDPAWLCQSGFRNADRQETVAEVRFDPLLIDARR